MSANRERYTYALINKFAKEACRQIDFMCVGESTCGQNDLQAKRQSIPCGALFTGSVTSFPVVFVTKNIAYLP